MSIIFASDLASYPGMVAGDDRLDALAEMASALVLDAWASPVNPPPLWVVNIAKAAAARAAWNPKGLEMLSRQIDDAKRTEQFGASYAGKVGVYLTDAESALLNGVVPSAGVGSIRTRVWGWS